MTDMNLMLLGIVATTIIAVWVWNDADNLRSRGARISPLVWAAFSWFLLGFGLPAYLLMREFTWKKQALRSDSLDLGDIESLPEPDMTPDDKYAPWKVA